jgi:hypothetical protein
MVLILLFPYAIESIENKKQKNKKILFRLNRNKNRRKSQTGEKKREVEYMRAYVSLDCKRDQLPYMVRVE